MRLLYPAGVQVGLKMSYRNLWDFFLSPRSPGPAAIFPLVPPALPGYRYLVPGDLCGFILLGKKY